MSKSQSLQQKLVEDLIRRIKSRELMEGERIPSERSLCDEYSVSRMTVRLALTELERQGYVVRKHGSGTYVSLPAVINTNLSSFYSFSSEMRRLGYQFYSRILNFSMIPCPEQVRESMQIGKETVFRIARLRYIEDKPLITEVSYIPVALCPNLNEEDVLKNGLYRTLELNADIKIVSAQETFEAVMPPLDVLRKLEIGEDLPTLRLIRLARDKDGIVEYCESYIRGDMYKYTIFLQ